MQRSGLIICPGNGRMMALGVPVLALGFAALIRQKLPQIALHYMTDLTEKYRLGVSLAVRDGLEMTYLQRTHGDITFTVGARRPIATAPTAWACIAAYDEAERNEVLKTLEGRQGAAWPTTQRHLRQAVDEYREHEFVLSIGVMHEHFNALAVAIRPADGGPMHGLSISGLASIWPRARLLTIAPELIAIARELGVVRSAV